MTSVRRLLPLALAASLGAGVASAGVGDDRPRYGVLVETTRGPSPAAVAAARADVARLRARGLDAELRVTRSPSESLSAAATLATRGATTLVTRGADEARVLAPVRRGHPRLRIVRR